MTRGRRNSGWKEQKSDLPVAELVVGSTVTNTHRETQALRQRSRGTCCSCSARSPDLPLPAPTAAASAWKSWDLPLMLNHFLTRLLDHDSCKRNHRNKEEEQQGEEEGGQVSCQATTRQG